MDPITILAALGPLAVEFGKAAISRWIAPKDFKPATVEQWTQMRELDLKLFQALQDAGGKGDVYIWVESVVRLMRPGVAIIVLVTWANAHGLLWNAAEIDTDSIDNFASAIGFYLFGDRSLFYTNKAASNSLR